MVVSWFWNVNTKEKRKRWKLIWKGCILLSFDRVIEETDNKQINKLPTRKGLFRGRICKTIGFTLLYFKMGLIPLVPKTKMVDVGKLISLGNLLVRKVMWFVLTTTSASLILSHVFGADHTTRIAYIYSRLPRVKKVSSSFSFLP